MAHFIEIKPGISVKAEEIEGVLEGGNEEFPNATSIVYTQHNDYPSIFSKDTLLNLLEAIDSEGRTETGESEQGLLQAIRNIQGEAGFFAG